MTTDTTQYVFTAYVHMSDDDGTPHAFGPGDPIPAWAVPLVGEHVRTEADSTKPQISIELITPEDTLTFVPDKDLPPHPPTKGPGSGQPAWYDWAADVGAVAGIGITRTWTKQDIIDALIRQGYLTE